MAENIREILLSLATVVLAILTIGVFIFYGANATFYILVIATIALGMANAYLISKVESKAEPKPHIAKPEKAIAAGRKKRAKRGRKA